MKKIIITMEGGLVQDIQGIPSGIEIEVQDFDPIDADYADEKDAQIRTNDKEEEYTYQIWESEEQPEPHKLTVEAKPIRFEPVEKE